MVATIIPVKTQQRTFIEQMNRAKITGDREKLVEHAVTEITQYWFSKLHEQSKKVHVSYPHDTDGLVSITDEGLFADIAGNRHILIETKRGKNYSEKKHDIAATLCQVVYYLRRFKDEGLIYPNAVIIADEDEMFALPVTTLDPHVNQDHDWSITPSQAHRENLDLFEELLDDKNVHPHIHAVDSRFSVNEFFTSVRSMAEGKPLEKVSVTKDNLARLFDKFSYQVFSGRGVPNKEQIKIFIRLLKGDDDMMLHTKKKNTLVIGDKTLSVHAGNFEHFWNTYDSNNYTLNELKEITEIADTLIEDFDRRFSGDFWTPKVWVDQSQDMITEALGENWRDEYVVWDPAAGAKNLTREYKFSHLYSSTLHPEELSISEWYNKDNVAFQYDFLNDDMWLHEWDDTGGGSLTEHLSSFSDEELKTKLKMPVSLVRALLAKKKIVFYTNPPYGQATTGLGLTHKSGASKDTGVAQLMNGMSHASMELYTQFIYRTQLLAELFGYTDDFHFFFFNNKGFLTSPNFYKFNEKLTSQFHYNNGFMINAGEFSGTSSAWGIIFSHWSVVGDKNQREFDFEVLRTDDQGDIEKMTDWVGKIKNKDDSISTYMRSTPIGKEPDENVPITNNGFGFTAKKSYVSMKKGWMGYLVNIGSNVQKSGNDLQLYSMGAAMAHGRDVTPENFDKVLVTFSVRRSVQENIYRKRLLWVKDKDMFSYPSENLLTDEFIADCVVYSLFNKQSLQTSLRNYKYNGNTYRVENEFFPFSKQFINDLAVEHNNFDIQVDLEGDNERFVHTWLVNNVEHISEEAQDVLDMAEQLITDSFPVRQRYKKLSPDNESRYQVNNWDAGWVQINRMIFGNDRLNDEFMSRLPEWKKVVTVLGDKIAAAAYEDGVI